MWVGVTVENTFMGGWMYLFRKYLWVGVDFCDCLRHIYEWVYLSKRYKFIRVFKRLLWVGVTVYSTSMGECDCLEHFYRWVWVAESGCWWVWVDMTGCGWVGKTLKPIMNCFGAALRKEPHLVVYVTFEDQN